MSLLVSFWVSGFQTHIKDLLVGGYNLYRQIMSAFISLRMFVYIVWWIDVPSR